MCIDSLPCLFLFPKKNNSCASIEKEYLKKEIFLLNKEFAPTLAKLYY